MAIMLLGVSVWQKNFLFSFFILMAEILVLRWGNQPPRTMDFVLTEKELTIGDEKFYPLSEFKSFNMEKDEFNDDDWIDVNLFFHAKVKPSLKIRTPKEESHNVEKALLMVLPKVEWEPSFIETIERLLKF